jgi:hypothetical protein
MLMRVAARDAGRPVVRYVALAMLCMVVAGCSSSASPPPAAAPTRPPATRPPATPDPCTVLTLTQIISAFQDAGTSISAVGSTTKDTYDSGRDETGVEVQCYWNFPSPTLEGTTVPGVVLTISPANLYDNASCATKVAGIGDAACVDTLGDLNVKSGFFAIDITDSMSTKPNPAVEKDLATDALALLPS